MSVKIHPREQGATLKCNQCPATLTTGQVQAGLIRDHAKKRGWIRGLWKPGTAKRAANSRDDICPACAPAEKKAAADRKAAADARRSARTARVRMTPEEKREARKKRDRERRAAKRAGEQPQVAA